MNLKVKATVIDETDLPWAKLAILQDSVHKMKVTDPLEGSDMGLFQNEGRIGGREVST